MMKLAFKFVPTREFNETCQELKALADLVNKESIKEGLCLLFAIAFIYFALVILAN